MDELFQNPPTWSLLTGDVGRGAVLAAAALFALTGLASAFAPKLKLGAWAFYAGCGAVLAAFASLTTLFVTSRFEYAYVWAHGDKANALQYRVAAVWSGQEGSFLLWATAAAICALFTVGRTGDYRRWYTVATSVVLGGLASILAFESPFRMNLFDGKVVMPETGQGLAPSLLNYWVVIHPPVIFLGFGALTVLFAMGFAAMMSPDRESWLPLVRPWSIAAMSVLGLGLCMGGFWAYETLGWGGFWMWDPVENVSFVPWVLTIAFTHGLLVQKAKQGWGGANLLMGGLPFLVFVYGTFLTRSGMLSQASVHSFAEMESSALKLLLVLMGVTFVGYLGLWGIRLFQARKETDKAPAAAWNNRKGWYLAGNISLGALAFATLVGMSVPLVQALKGQAPKVVEEVLYHQVLSWVFIPLMFFMSVAPFISWKGTDPKELGQRLYTILCVAVGLAATVVFLFLVTPMKQIVNFHPAIRMPAGIQVNGLAWVMFLLTVCSFTLVGNAWKVVDLWKRSKLGTAPFLAHLGVATLMTGLILSRGLEMKEDTFVMEGHPGKALGYTLEYKGMSSDVSDRWNQAKFDVFAPGQKTPAYTATPGMYQVNMPDGSQSMMVWPSIRHTPFYDVYFSLGQAQKAQSEPMTLPLNETVNINGAKVTYTETTRTGEFGAAGTKFGAKLVVEKEGKKETLEPQLQIGSAEGLSHQPVKSSDGTTFDLLGMNVADKSIQLQIGLDMWVFPVEIFHKPLTGLVWFGTGLMTIAGLLSAFAARASVKSPSPARKGKRVQGIADDRELASMT